MTMGVTFGHFSGHESGIWLFLSAKPTVHVTTRQNGRSCLFLK